LAAEPVRAGPEATTAAALPRLELRVGRLQLTFRFTLAFHAREVRFEIAEAPIERKPDGGNRPVAAIAGASDHASAHASAHASDPAHAREHAPDPAGDWRAVERPGPAQAPGAATAGEPQQSQFERIFPETFSFNATRHDPTELFLQLDDLLTKPRLLGPRANARDARNLMTRMLSAAPRYLDGLCGHLERAGRLRADARLRFHQDVALLSQMLLRFIETHELDGGRQLRVAAW